MIGEMGEQLASAQIGWHSVIFERVEVQPRMHCWRRERERAEWRAPYKWRLSGRADTAVRAAAPPAAAAAGAAARAAESLEGAEVAATEKERRSLA
uniref:Uncharacterized protein n=1 Tax=Pristionchus pacificus TaxID=54126 RepID=A0A2A6B6D1_PRIPA|eukprot:PDM61411.1 hypothetical protein PRIPAC_50853 [Pristionchus pacificus]